MRLTRLSVIQIVMVGAVVVAVPAAMAASTARHGRSPGQGAGHPRSASPAPIRTRTPTASPQPTATNPGTAASATPSHSQTTAASTAGVWKPAPGTTWQWQITGTVAAPYQNVTMYDIDLQDALPSARTITVTGLGTVTWPAGTNAGVVDRLHAAGKKVICYLDTGAYESYRPDAKLFAASVLGNSTGWDNERWLDLRQSSWSKFAPIMWSRLDLARSIGCDGVEPDQNNPYGNSPGFAITLADERAWYLEVAKQAHSRGLSVGMKNGVEVLDASTVAAFDWSLNEECFYFSECDTEQPFVTAGKAVFQTEYTDDWTDKNASTTGAVQAKVCASARTRKFSTLIKNKVPDTLFVPC